VPDFKAPAAPQRVKYDVLIVDFDSQPGQPTPVTGLHVDVCPSVACQSTLPDCPNATPGPTEQCKVVSTPAAQVPFFYEINLPYNFQNGSLRLTAPPDYTPMDYFFGGPMVGSPDKDAAAPDHVVGLTIPMVKATTLGDIYRRLGLPTVDPSVGTLAVRTLSCARDPAGPSPPLPAGLFWGHRSPDVTVTAQPETPAGAVAYTLSNSNVFSQNAEVTDARGVAGFVNVRDGSIDLKALASDGLTPYAAGRVTTIPMRPGVITIAELRAGLDLWGQ